MADKSTSGNDAADELLWQPGDLALAIIGLLIFALGLIRDRKLNDRVADIEVPHGILSPVLFFTLIRQRRMDRALARLRAALEAFGPFVGNRMRETDQRQTRLVDLQASLEEMARSGEEREETLAALQASVERYTRVLVTLTVVLAVLGAAAIGATVWAAVH